MNELWRPCPICGGGQERVILDGGMFQFFSDGPHKQMRMRDVQCGNCLTLYKNPCYSPEGMANLFAEAGRSYGNALQADAQAEWVSPLLVPDSVVFDVGCGSGKFLKALPTDMILIGMEMDIQAEQAMDAGVVVVESVDTFSNLIKVSDLSPADVITMWHVLEHLADPMEMLTSLHSISGDHTYLVVEVPVLEMGATPDVTGFISPQHVTHFSRHTLEMALNLAGWRIREQLQMPYNGWRVLCSADKRPVVVDEDPGDHLKLMNYMFRQFSNIAEVERRVSEITKPGIIWGAGMHIESLYQWTTLFRRFPPEKWWIIDGDSAKRGKYWRGSLIHGPESSRGTDWGKFNILVSSYGSQSAIVNAALDLGAPINCIQRLYPMVKEVY